MPAYFKSGFTHLILTSLFALLLLFVATFQLRPYVYAAYQTAGYKLGLNFNNIATDSYKQWIQTQPITYNKDLQAVFLNKKVAGGNQLADNTAVLGQTTGVDDNKWIEISLGEQRLYMKDHGNTVGSFLVSTGKWAPTPTGDFRIWTKLRYTRMTGGNQAWGTFYDLPNVPYVMYFNQGVGIHGTYWHNNFGHPMSHGCVNMKTEEAAIVYNWASVGTRVIVHN